MMMVNLWGFDSGVYWTVFWVLILPIYYPLWLSIIIGKRVTVFNSINLLIIHESKFLRICVAPDMPKYVLVKYRVTPPLPILRDIELSIITHDDIFRTVRPKSLWGFFIHSASNQSVGYRKLRFNCTIECEYEYKHGTGNNP